TLEYVKAARGAGAHLCGLPVLLRIGVLVAGPAAAPLVPARAERVTAVLGGGTVAGEQDDAHPRVEPRMVQGPVQLVDRGRAEGAAHLGPVAGGPDPRQRPPGARAVRCSDRLPAPRA